MSLGVPVMACPTKNPFVALASADIGVGAFAEGLESASAIIDTAWKLRPDGLIHIGSMDLQESEFPPTLAIEVMRTVAVSSLMAKTLDVPFVYVTPGGLGDTPSTPKGAQGMLLEDLVEDDQTIVQVNGLFGPRIENQVKRWVTSEKLTVDDTRKVNPVSESTLTGIICEFATTRLVRLDLLERSVITVGGPQTTWYEFFVNAGLTKALPWTDPLSHNRQRELRWEWSHEMILHPMEKSLSAWYSAVHDST